MSKIGRLVGFGYHSWNDVESGFFRVEISFCENFSFLNTRKVHEWDWFLTFFLAEWSISDFYCISYAIFESFTVFCYLLVMLVLSWICFAFKEHSKYLFNNLYFLILNSFQIIALLYIVLVLSSVIWNIWCGITHKFAYKVVCLICVVERLAKTWSAAGLDFMNSILDLEDLRDLNFCCTFQCFSV